MATRKPSANTATAKPAATHAALAAVQKSGAPKVKVAVTDIDKAHSAIFTAIESREEAVHMIEVRQRQIIIPAEHLEAAPRVAYAVLEQRPTNPVPGA